MVMPCDMNRILPDNSSLFLNARKAIYVSIVGLLLLAFVVPVYAMRPSFVDSVTCGTNEGWDHPPTVLILTASAPTVDNNAGGDVGAVLLVRDAISEYWNELADVDGDLNLDSEPDGPANSAFANLGFGDVSLDAGGDEITISFIALDPGVIGQASCTIDESGNIISAVVKLTTEVAGLNDEDYKNAAAHELAHAIGLSNHSGPPGNLMFRAISGPDAYLPLSRSAQRTLTSLYG